MIKNKRGISVFSVIIIILIIVLAATVAFLAVKAFGDGKINILKKDDGKQNDEEVNIYNDDEQSTDSNEQKEVEIDASKYHMNIYAKKAFEEKSEDKDKVYSKIYTPEIILADIVKGRPNLVGGVKLDEEKNEVFVYIRDLDDNFYGDSNEITGFSGKVDEVSIEPYGKDNNSYTIFFTLNDCTVEYIEFYEAMTAQEGAKVKKINGLKNVVRIATKSGDTKEPFALDIDGKYHRIYDYIDMPEAKFLSQFVEKHQK